MFRPIPMAAAAPQPMVDITIEGRRVQVQAGQMLATALLTAGVLPFRRTPVSGAPRAPMCLMGVCFDCLVELDGVQNVQSCMTEVRAGMRVRLPGGARRPEEAA